MRVVMILALALLGLASEARAQENDLPYHVVDGKVDKGTYNGYRRYHASCHTCHGPDGLGSSYAPSLLDSLETLDYAGFVDVVVNGRETVTQNTQSIMPSFGYVDDVMLYIDDIYGYLKARSDGVIGRGRPTRHDR